MKSLNQALVALLLGSAMLTACGEKKEDAAPVAPAAAPAPEVKKEPVKEEPGGWVPPAEDRVPGITIPAEGAPAATPEAAAPAAEATPAAPAAAEKSAK